MCGPRILSAPRMHLIKPFKPGAMSCPRSTRNFSSNSLFDPSFREVRKGNGCHSKMTMAASARVVRPC